MLTRRLHPLLLILLLALAELSAPAATTVTAASAPPERLTRPRTNKCLKTDGTPSACWDGDVADVDSAVDGQTVAFSSSSNSLVTSDRNQVHDVFVWRAGSDTQTDTVARASVDANGTEGNHASDQLALSGNGRYLYFRSFASNWVADTQYGTANLYLKDLESGQLSLISRDAEGMPINGESQTDHFVHIDTDYSGRYAVFASAFGEYVAGITDTNDARDIFLVDVDPNGNGDYFDSVPQIYPLSVTSDGLTTGNNFSHAPSIAQNGSAVVWLTRATDLASGLASNGSTQDVVMARFGTHPDGSVDPSTRTLTAINRMGNNTTTLTPQGATLARMDPWRNQVAFVTADAIPGTGDNHSGYDVFVSVGHSEGHGNGADNRTLMWASASYSATMPSTLALAWDPQPTVAPLSQVAWVAQPDPRPVPDLLLRRNAPFFPTGWTTVNWLDAATPSGEAVRLATLSADGRFAFWTTTESYGLEASPGSVHLFRRAIAPAQSVPLTIQGVGGSATYAPEGTLLAGTMHYSPTTVVTLTPQAATGYRFRAWVGVDAISGPTATVIVYGARTVTATFDAMTRPQTADIHVSTPEEIPITDLTLTITDPDPDETHTISLVQPPTHGTAQVIDSTITYQPAPDFSRQDTFTLQVTDAYGLQLAAPAQVTVDVLPVNDAPTADDLALTIAEDTLLADVALPIYDPDVEDTHTLSLVQPPDHGTVTINAAATTFSYLPAPNFHGQDLFTLQVRDAAGLMLATPAQVTMTITSVNDAPHAAHAQSSGKNTGSAIIVPVTVHDVDDAEGHVLTIVSPPTSGTVRVGDGGEDAPSVFEYTPEPNFTGVDTFDFRATDRGKASITATATVTVTAPITPTTPLTPTTPITPSLPITATLHLPTLRHTP